MDPKPLRLCFVVSELSPFVKTGGLADVTSALARYLGRQGHDVRVLLPLYDQVRLDGAAPAPVEGLVDRPLRLGSHDYTYTVRSAPLLDSPAQVLFVDCPALYHRRRVYTHDPDEHRRFLFLTHAAIQSCQHLRFAPHVFHCHDWQSALIPIYLETVYSWDRLFERSRTLLTIHNLGYQGTFGAAILDEAGLANDAHRLHQDDLRHGVLNFLKTGILYADLLSTVSPTYALEIQTEEHGMGLAPLLRHRRDALVGILNGVSYEEWQPETDPHIPFRYSPRDLEGKERNRTALLVSCGLEAADGAPVLASVSRLAEQKGFDLLFDVLPDLLRRRPLRFVLLGTGEDRFTGFFHWLQREFPGKVHFRDGFDDAFAHRIQAGADLFLMPSRYEPCGLSQMYSLRYGTVPVVRRTGGLADTVEQWNPATREGTGFLFQDATPDALRWALGFALDTFEDRSSWRRLMDNGMARNYSWEVQGARYVTLYRRLGAPAAASRRAAL